MENVVRIIPVGGCGEIGLNMTLLNIGSSWYFIDCGILFPDAGAHGIDFVIPDTKILEERGIFPRAWFITHAHEDHIGALPFLYEKFRAPIYGSALTLEFLRTKFSEYGISDSEMHAWSSGESKMFEDLIVSPLGMHHSIPDALGLLFETDVGNILHTGDFRIDAEVGLDEMKKVLTKVLGQGKIDLMLTDSTNIFASGRDGVESSLLPSFVEIMAETTGTVVVVSFASSIWRFKTVLEAAVQTKRRVHFLGRSLRRNLDIAMKIGLLDLPPGLVVSEDELPSVERSKLCVLSSGSQGESFSGAFRLAMGHIPDVKLGPDDALVLSARTIPGNERSVGMLMNHFARTGVRIITASDRTVHVSGHAFQDDIREAIHEFQPSYYFPVHGEFRHLQKHVDVAQECGIAPEKCVLAEDGDVVVWTQAGIEIEERWDFARSYVSQGCVLNSNAFKSRMQVARMGFVCLSFALKQDAWDLASDPIAVCRGVPLRDEHLSAKLRDISLPVLVKAKEKAMSDATFSEELRLAVRRHIELETGYKTVVQVMLHRCG